MEDFLVAGSKEWCLKRIISEAGIGNPAVKPYGTILSPSITVGIAQVASPDTQEVYLHPYLIQLMDAFQDVTKTTPNIIAGYMTPQHCAKRVACGLDPATFLSAHEVGVALTLANTRNKRDIGWYQLSYQLSKAAAAAKIPVPTFHASGSCLRVSYIRHLFAPSGGPVSSPLTWDGLDPEVRKFFSAWMFTRT